LANCYWSIVFVPNSFITTIQFESKFDQSKLNLYYEFCGDKMIELMDFGKIQECLSQHRNLHARVFDDAIRYKDNNFQGIRNITSGTRYNQAILPTRVRCKGYDACPAGSLGWVLPVAWTSPYARGNVAVIYDQPFPGAHSLEGAIKDKDKQECGYWTDMRYLEVLHEVRFVEEAFNV